MASAIQLPSDEYTQARREWRDRYADLAQGKRNWQCAALGFFLIAALTSAIAIIQVRQVKRLPYLVQMDPTGAVVTVLPQLSPSSTVIPMAKIERAVVAQCIRDARTAIDDFAGENMLLAYLQAHVRAPADRYVEAYLNAHNPHIVARKHTVNVIITSLVQLAPHSWQVRWTEQYLDRDGMRDPNSPDTHWIAPVTTQLLTQQDLGNPAGVNANPEGVVITHWQWAPETLGQVTAQ
jgi:type IV secretory pathway TrbF-like protein